MATEAQRRAEDRYRKENVRSFNLKFNRNTEADRLAWFEKQGEKAQYIKGLIDADMEGRIVNDVRKYAFESANMGTVEFHVDGEWVGGGKDVSVMVGTLCREFADIDGGGVDEIFQWLVDSGVEFESDRSLWFNHQYVASVMIDGDATQAQLLDEAATKSAEYLADWKEWMLA